jgi:hypothetical protein
MIPRPEDQTVNDARQTAAEASVYGNGTEASEQEIWEARRRGQ